MPRAEVDYTCRRCGKTYQADVGHAEGSEGSGLEGSQARCPYCGEWNCTGPSPIARVARSTRTK